MKLLFRVFSLFSLIALVSWLMPLGVFIKPSQEKTACDGKRAFHMCSMMGEGVSETSQDGQVHFSNTASGLEKHAKTQSAGGDEFLAARRPRFHAPAFAFWLQEVFISPPSVYNSLPYRPPQASSATP